MILADATCPECGQELEVEIPDGEDWHNLIVDCDSCGETDMGIVEFDADKKTLVLELCGEDEEMDEDPDGEDD